MARRLSVWERILLGLIAAVTTLIALVISFLPFIIAVGIMCFIVKWFFGL